MANTMHSEMPAYTEDECRNVIRLKLHGFKIYSDHEISIPSNNVVLVNGPSGSGKTSMLDAFVFILYNGIKDPEEFKTKKCWGWLFINNLIIYRQKDRMLLKVWRRNIPPQEGCTEFTNDEAQNLINDVFGTIDMFYACSYIKQKGFSVFMNGSDAEKLAIVKGIAMRGSELDATKIPIEQAVKYFTEQYNIAKAQLDMAIEQIKLFDRNNPSIAKFQIPENPQEVFEKVQQLRSQHDSLDRELGDSMRKETTISMYRGQMNQLDGRKGQIMARLNQYPKLEVIKPRLEELDVKIRNLNVSAADPERIVKSKIYSFWSQENGRIRSQLTTAETDIEILTKTINKDRPAFPILLLGTEKAKRDEAKILAETMSKENSQKCELVGGVLNEVKILLRQVNALTITDVESKLTSIAGEITASEKKKEVIQAEIDKQRMTNKMPCPSCKAVLIIGSDGKRLEKCQDAPSLSGISAAFAAPAPTPELSRLPVAPVVTFADLEKEVRVGADLSAKRDLMQEIIKSCKAKLATVEGGDVNISPLHDLTIRFNKFFELVKNHEQISALLTHHDSTKPEQVSAVVEDTTVQKGQLEYERSTLQSNMNEIVNLQQILETEQSMYVQMSKSCSEAESMPGSKTEVIYDRKRQIQGQIDQLMHISSSSELMAHRSIMEKTMQEKMERATSLEAEKAASSRLLVKTKDAERAILQTAVSQVNTILNEILKRLFKDTPISVRITTTKVLKDKKAKASNRFDIKVIHNNFEYKSVDSLSGGEKDRLSMAITLAMNRKFGSPLLFLDETLSSLNAELKSEAVAVLKEAAPGKTIVCVSHDETEGIYDKVMRIKAR